MSTFVLRLVEGMDATVRVESFIIQKKKMTQLIIKSEQDLKVALAGEYRKQIENYFGDDKKALEFLSSVVASVQRLPTLFECSPVTLINSFMMMAQLKLMPSGVSGEAYVLPYRNKGVMEAQFQLGYQGLVTLFYRAGVRSIVAEIVYDNDKFSYHNGVLSHDADPFSDDRGKAKGAYVVVELQAGGKVTKVMSKKEIMGIGRQFSKSFDTTFSPWNEKNDPQLWMWKKTVLKQAAKLVPKNETIFKAIDEDNKDSIIHDRMNQAKVESSSLKMGNLLKDGKEKNTSKKPQAAPENQDGPSGAESGATGAA